MKTALFALLLLSLMAGCTNQTTWEPTIDVERETDPKILLEDLKQCQEKAFAASTHPHATADSDIFGGAAIGSLAGALIGGLLGSSKQGALLGGAAGVHATAGDLEYRHTYTECLIDRGHAVLNSLSRRIVSTTSRLKLTSI